MLACACLNTLRRGRAAFVAGEQGYIASTMELPYIAQEPYSVRIEDERSRSKLESLLDQLDELEDVQNVYHNAVL